MTGNELRDLRLKHHVPAREIVNFVQKHYPKVDIPLLSKAENTDKYGVSLPNGVVQALYQEFAPEALPRIKHQRNGRHRLTRAVFCRIDNDTHAALLEKLSARGYPTVQAWLTEVVNNYIKEGPF